MRWCISSSFEMHHRVFFVPKLLPQVRAVKAKAAHAGKAKAAEQYRPFHPLDRPFHPLNKPTQSLPPFELSHRYSLFSHRSSMPLLISSHRFSKPLLISSHRFSKPLLTAGWRFRLLKAVAASVRRSL